MAKEKDIDVRTEMAIALFWRGLIGDAAYGRFDPDDLLRWYFALELRGPMEIRELVDERCVGRPVKEVLGIVNIAPHPPLWLIMEWLERYEQKVYAAVPLAMAGCTLVLSLIFFANLQGCANLTPLNPLNMNPPQGSAAVTPYTQPSASYATPPTVSGASAAMPPTVQPPGTVTQTGPQSGGIAGATSGSVSPTGSTGPQSNGIAGATTH